MERGYLFLTSGYRVILSLISLSILWSLDSQGFTQTKIIETLILVGYAAIFSIFSGKRITNYIEWVAILALLFYLPTIPTLYFLLLMPFIQVISLRARQIDFLFLSVSLAIFSWYDSSSILEAFSLGIAIYVAGFMLNLNFNKISALEKILKDEKRENEELAIQNSVKTNQIEVVSKLFIHKQKLDKLDNTEKLIEQTLRSSMDFFNSYYVVMYYFQNNVYHQVADKGDKNKYDVSNSLSLEQGKEIYIDKQLLRVPISYEKRPWGVVGIYGKRSRLGEEGQMVSFSFEESDYEILSIYLDSVMSRLKEIRRNDKLKKAALFDRLTELPNRTYLEGDLFKDKLTEIKTNGTPFAVMMIDIDNFKSFNDSFGHNIGDEVLRVVARVANETLQKFEDNDIIGRWGGEEFLGYINGEPAEVAKKLEQLRTNIERFQFKYRDITISLGVAFFGVDSTNFTEIVKKADTALYESKKTGKNRLTFYRRGMEL